MAADRRWSRLHLLAPAETKAWRSPSLWCLPTMTCFPFPAAEGKPPCASAMKSKDVLKKLETYLPVSGKSVFFFFFLYLLLVDELGEKLFLTLMASGGQEKREMEGTKS